jgi:hypothetical protein
LHDLLWVHDHQQSLKIDATYRFQSNRFFVTESFGLIATQRQGKNIAPNIRVLLEITSRHFEEHALNLFNKTIVSGYAQQSDELGRLQGTSHYPSNKDYPAHASGC